jgi:hypothetical protein
MREGREMVLARVRFAPALGGGGRLPRSILLKRIVAGLLLLLFLGIAKHFIAARESGPGSLSSLPDGRFVTTGLVIGGTPLDSDLQALADGYHVDGVINIGDASVAEQVTASSLHQAYHFLYTAPGNAPTWSQLASLLVFMHKYASAGETVYMHDSSGGGRAVTTADMLLLLRGESWRRASVWMTAAERQSLSGNQRRAIQQLISALLPETSEGNSGQRNPYAAARVTSW